MERRRAREAARMLLAPTPIDQEMSRAFWELLNRDGSLPSIVKIKPV